MQTKNSLTDELLSQSINSDTIISLRYLLLSHTVLLYTYFHIIYTHINTILNNRSKEKEPSAKTKNMN